MSTCYWCLFYVQNGVVAVRVFGCKGLSKEDFQLEDDIVVCARVIMCGMGKSTTHIPFSKGRPIWDEVLLFPVQVRFQVYLLKS